MWCSTCQENVADCTPAADGIARCDTEDDDVPRLGVTALTGNDEDRRRSGALAVEEQSAAIPDVDKSGEVLFTRLRATSEDGKREDEPEQGLHVPDDTTDPRQRWVERVLVLG